MNTVFTFLLIAVVVNAMLVGASLDQSIKQLPSRHQIGVVAYSEYSKAADLRNGVAWYASLGVGAALITLIASVTGLVNQSSSGTTALWLAIVFTLAHSVTTSQAAPINFKQRKVAGDAEQLTMIFNRFVRWQTARLTFQILSLLAVAWALGSRV